MTPSEVFRRYLEMCEHLQYGRLGSLLSNMWSEENWGKADSAPAFTQHVTSAVLGSHVYLVTDQMTDAIVGTADRYLTGLETVTSDPPPQGCGVAFLERPLNLVEIRNRSQFVHMISWGPARTANAGTATLVVLWSDLRRDVDEVMADDPYALEVCLRHVGGFSAVSFVPLLAEARIGPPRANPSEEQINRLRAEGVDLDSIPTETPNPNRWAVALWRLLNDSVGTARSTAPPFERSVRRYAQRLNKKPSLEVVTLRRKYQPILDPGSGVPLQWRSPVGGHYRTYWTGPGRTEAVRKWVRAHERGPEDAPLKPKKGTVYRLAR